MASRAQIEANRTNSTLSTGPVTDAGKQNSSRNAVTHGMTSAKLIVPGEDPAAFEALLADTLSRLAPEGELERSLAEAVAVAHWRHLRMLRYEAAFWCLETSSPAGADSQVDPDLAAAMLFTDPAAQRKLGLLLRYVTAAERAYKNAFNAFEQARATRPEPEHTERDDEDDSRELTMEEINDFFDNHLPPPPVTHATPGSPRRPEIGFVSQTVNSEKPKAA